MDEKKMSLHEEELERIARALATKILAEAETKRVFKEALNEWLDHKFADFGKWSAVGILSTLFVAFVVIVMWTQGYHK